MTDATLTSLVLRLPCCAPRAPDRCHGVVAAFRDASGAGPVPLCAGHLGDIGTLEGPWKSPGAVSAWLAGMREVIRAEVVTSSNAGRLYLENGGTTPVHQRAPWVDWAAVKAGKVPPPNVDSTGQPIGRAAYNYPEKYRQSKAPTRKRIAKSKAIEKTEENAQVSVDGAEKKPNRWGKMPWWLRNKLKAEKSK